MQRFRRQTQLLLPWVYFQKCLQILHKLQQLYSGTGGKKWNKTSCCYACMLFSFGKTVPVRNRRHICLKLDCSMFTTPQVSGESNKLLWWSSSRSRLLFRARTNKGKKQKTKTKNRIKKCSSVSQLNKRGGEDRKGTVGGPKSYCQHKTLSRSDKFKIKKKMVWKKLLK